MNAKAIYVPLFIVASLSLSACDVRAQDSEGAATSEAELSRSVRVITAEEGVLSVTRSATATINAAQESLVSAASTGQVEAILVQSGSVISQGQTVIRLDDTAVRLQLDNARLALQTAQVNLQKGERSSGSNSIQSQAALQAAQLGFDAARRQYDEGQKLLAAGGISQNELTQLELAFEQAEASFLQAQAAAEQVERAPQEDLELLRLQVQQAQTQVAQAEQAFADTAITAPFAGEIAEVLVQEGEFIGAGNPAFRLIGSDRQEATFNVAPEDASRLLEQGQIWLPYNGLDYAAQVRRTSQAQGGRLVEVTAELYPSESRIPNGTSTQFDYDLELARGILIPSGALKQTGANSALMVVEGGKAAEQRVTIMSEGGAQLVVSGIDAGTQVIFPLPADLTPGTPVEIVGGGA